MTGPEPTMDDLLAIGVSAYWEARGVNADDDAVVRAILTAVLPRVLEGAREALGWAIREAPGPCQDDECTADDCAHARLARSVHSRIDSLCVK